MLGERLQRFHAHTTHLSETTRDVSAHLSEETMRQEIDGLRYIIEQTEFLQKRSRRSAASLCALLDELIATRHHLATFTNISRHLHSLCNMIKIETARLGNAAGSFASLASDVGALVADIEEHRSELWKQSESLISLLRASVQHVAQIEARQSTSTTRVVRETEKKLEAVHQHRGHVARALTRISSQWATISGDIGGVVVSLQSHDSTRQRLEHVADALATIIEKAPAGDGIEDRIVLQTCRLQEAQIESAGHEAVGAARQMVGSLFSLAGSVRAIAGESASDRTVGTSDVKGFWTDLEQSLLAIRSATVELEDLNRSLATALSQVARPVEAMSSLLEDIARVGGTLRLLGLNACVHAAHVGEAGAALSLLAEDVHRVSQETSENIEAVANRLASTITMASRISADSSVQEALERGSTVDLRQRVDGMITEVTPKIREGSAMLERIEHEAASLAKEITATADNVRVNRRLARGLDAVLELMDRVIDTAEQRAADHPESPEEARLVDAFSSRYTMHGERLVHRAMMVKAACGVPTPPAVKSLPKAGTPVGEVEFFDDLPPTAAAPQSVVEDMGGNVELFDDFCPPVTPKAAVAEDLGSNVELF